jgi:hypothetical protein
MTRFPRFIFIDDTTIEREQPQNILRSEMEVGPQKTKPIQSIPLFNISFEIALPFHRFKDYNDWFKSVRYGADWFLLRDPIDGALKRFRIVEYDTFKKEGSLMRSRVKVEAYDV